MQVRVDDIPDSDLQRSEVIPAEVWQDIAAASPDFSVVDAAPLTANFHKLSGRVLVHGAFDAVMRTSCRRCLDEVQVPVKVQFTLNFVPSRSRSVNDDADDGEQKKPQSRPVVDEDVSTEFFNGEVIDLTPVVREQALLALPDYVQCRADCKGLCPQCGENLNVRQCACRPPVDGRFVKLKDFKIQS